MIPIMLVLISCLELSLDATFAIATMTEYSEMIFSKGLIFDTASHPIIGVAVAAALAVGGFF